MQPTMRELREASERLLELPCRLKGAERWRVGGREASTITSESTVDRARGRARG